MESTIQHAIEIVKNGGIIIFPTDTAFGIGCRIDDEDAVKKLFKIRERPETKATPVLVSSISMVQKYVDDIAEEVQTELIEQYWPGALTIILNVKTKIVPELVRGGTNTIGLRMPNNITILEIIKSVGVPIIGSSANFSGEKTPYSIAELDPRLVQLVDFIVPGECTIRQASTVIDCTQTPWKILRYGAIKIEI